MPLFKQKKRQVYLDHAAATPLDSHVLAAMKPFLVQNSSNSSALYASAVEARTVIEMARKDVASVLQTQPDTVIFTSGGTESINLALLGAARAIGKGHIITSKIEHQAVLNTVKQLEREGFFVTYIDVDSTGLVQVEDIKKALREDTILVSIMYANNEVGSIQPIADIGREILKWRKNSGTQFPLFHTDACQASAYLDLSVEKLHVDLMSINGSKIYGPKGSGILHKRREIKIEPIMYGGGHEFGLRPGTEDVASIVGLSAALQQIQHNKSQFTKKVQSLQNYFWDGLQKVAANAKLNGPEFGGTRLLSNLNITIPGIDAEAFILYMDEQGVQCSSGSACASDSDDVSHVLLAMGMSEHDARSSIRFTLGKQTTKKDIDYVLEKIKEVTEKMTGTQKSSSVVIPEKKNDIRCEATADRHDDD